MTTAKTTPATKPPGSEPLVSTFVLGVGGVLLFLGMLLFVIFGRISGIEFSPQTLEYRYFRFYEIPLLRMQVSSVRYEVRDMPTIGALMSESYFPKPIAGVEDWDLVYGKRGFGKYEGDANILVDYLEATDHQGNSVWEIWSEDNPPLAAVFWPVVIDAVRKEEYTKMPDLFEKARQATTPEELAESLGVPVPAVLPPPKVKTPPAAATPPGTAAPATTTPPASTTPAEPPAV